MTNSDHHDEFAGRHAESMARIDQHLANMNAREKLHEEAFERSKAATKKLQEYQKETAERIRALLQLEGLDSTEHRP